MTPKRQALEYARGTGQLISLKQAASILGCNVDRARYLENLGELGPSYKIGTSLKVTRAGVEACLARREQS
jgi:hypothetical protein